MTCGHEAIATVVAFSAENENVLRRGKLVRDKVGNPGTCGFHQGLPGDVTLLDGAFIALTHFGCGQNIHVAVVREGAGIMQSASLHSRYIFALFPNG
jgi:hypothetical protein